VALLGLWFAILTAAAAVAPGPESHLEPIELGLGSLAVAAITTCLTSPVSRGWRFLVEWVAIPIGVFGGLWLAFRFVMLVLLTLDS
jgi:hypothetical protein